MASEPASKQRLAAGQRIPISAPAFVGRELEYAMSCVESTWISSRGDFVPKFECAFAALCGAGHGIAVCNGTAALHTALAALGVGPGDEVVMPSLTYMATANAVMYGGGSPVFVDSEPNTWNLDPECVAGAITPRTKGLIAVHLYGHPADMDALRAIADAHGLFLIEDAAQAHGSRYRDRPVGSLADAAAFSFYAGKLITTGEGGMCLTDDEERAALMRCLREQGQHPCRRYTATRLGFNYGMTNVAAAIGVAQLECIEWHGEQRRTNALRYRERLGCREGLSLQCDEPWAQSTEWLTSVILEDSIEIERDRLMRELELQGLETRPLFPPLHTQPVYAPSEPISLPVCERLGARGLSLPSGAALGESQIDFVSDALLRAIGHS
jgi:perosamine synthetase